MKDKELLRLPAVEFKQGPKRVLYTFAVDGKEISRFASVSRVSRSKDCNISGYQRPEVISHIAEIRNYLESPDPMVPNSLVIAFDDRLKFEPASSSSSEGYSRSGTLVIPLDDALPDERKPGWLVDGQQRAAAVRDAQVSQFPVSVVAFVARDIEEQREQFILVNSTKPLPKGLIYELLPTTEAKLPTLLQRRRFPALLLSRLNHDEASPMEGKIRTPTSPEGVIKDNSVLKVIENSLSDGVLYRFRTSLDGKEDVEAMASVLKAFWSAVAEVFSDAWELPPGRSRLTHGAGIVSFGFLMDAIADRYRHQEILTKAEFIGDLKPLKEVCRWTDGYWDFGPGAQRKWNEIQNTTKDIQVLSNYLLIQYKARVWDRSRTVTEEGTRGKGTTKLAKR
jgi:DGQHR domain-containing protein